MPNTQVQRPMEHPSSCFDCIICLNHVPKEERVEQRCDDVVCKSCFATYLRDAIMNNCVAFPRCPHPNCDAVSSDRLVFESTDLATTERMRYLRGLYPARARDGRRLWCAAEGCYEPLAPPQVAARDDAPHSKTAECGKCGTATCLGCGAIAHPGQCPTGVTSLRQQRLYAEYAVGKVSSCETCGAHVERNGGCDHMTCMRCKSSFLFRPFTSVREVQESMAYVVTAPDEVHIPPDLHPIGVVPPNGYRRTVGGYRPVVAKDPRKKHKLPHRQRQAFADTLFHTWQVFTDVPLLDALLSTLRTEQEVYAKTSNKIEYRKEGRAIIYRLKKLKKKGV